MTSSKNDNFKIFITKTNYPKFEEEGGGGGGSKSTLPVFKKPQNIENMRGLILIF